MSSLTPFHLAIPVNNLEKAKKFYSQILNCSEGRSSDRWVDYNFFGHQLVIHLDAMPIKSKVFNFVVRFFSNVKIHDFNCGLKAYRREVVKSLNLYGGMHRFIPFLASLNGFKTSEVIINHRKREFGESKYSSSRLAKGLFDFLTVLFIAKYSKRPMHFFGRLGLFISLFGFFILFYLSVQWLNGYWIGNRPLFYLGIMLVIVGLQFLSLGLVGELLVKYGYSSKEVIKRNINDFSK